MFDFYKKTDLGSIVFLVTQVILKMYLHTEFLASKSYTDLREFGM